VSKLHWVVQPNNLASPRASSASQRCRQRDKHAANAGKLAIGVVEGKRERRPVQRFQPEAPRLEPAGDDGKSRCLSACRTTY